MPKAVLHIHRRNYVTLVIFTVVILTISNYVYQSMTVVASQDSSLRASEEYPISMVKQVSYIHNALVSVVRLACAHVAQCCCVGQER